MIFFVAITVMLDVLKQDFGTVDFFTNHGYVFLISLALFPRLTLLFSSVATGGFVWWLGFFFCPRILVASLATVAYAHTNPLLVVISWIFALGGEYAEKRGLTGSRFVFRTYRPHSNPEPSTFLKKDDAIEAEFSKKD